MRTHRYVTFAMPVLFALGALACSSAKANDLDASPVCATAAPLRTTTKGEWLTATTPPDLAISVLTKLEAVVPDEELRLIDEVLPYFEARRTYEASGQHDPTAEADLTQQRARVETRIVLVGAWLSGTCDDV